MEQLKNKTKQQKILYSIGIVSLLSLIIFFVIGANPLKETIAPTDLFAHYAGFKSIDFPNHVEHPERSDVIDVIIPSWKGMKNIWKNYGIFPTKAASNLGAFSFVLIENESKAMYIGVFLRLLVGALGMYFFLSLLLPHFLARLFGTISFIFSGFNSGWLFWTQVDTIIWLPWILWAVLAYLKSLQLKYLLWLTIFSFLMIIAWFPAVAAFVFYGFSLLTLLWTIFHYQNIKSILKYFLIPHVFVGLSFLMSAYFIAPSIQTINRLGIMEQRLGTTTLTLEHLKLFFDPYSAGLPHPEFGLYTGIVAAILSIGAIGFFAYFLFHFKKNRDHFLFYLFGFIILLGAIIFGFGLINHDFIRLIPPFKNNGWNRITAMSCFAIAFLSSLFINDILTSFNKTKLRFFLLAIFSALFLYQFMDLKSLFNDYNAIVKSEYFYPTTPTIEYIKTNTTNTDYIIADNAFGISGTLRYYGLQDWYSHGFKSVANRQLLEDLIPNSFATNTASSFQLSQVKDFNSPLFDMLGVKYMLTTYPITQSYPPLPEGENIPILMAPYEPYEQVFELEDSISASGVSAFFGTYSEIALEVARFRVVIVEERDSSVLYEKIYKNVTFNNNQWFTFDFENNVPLEGHKAYQISFELFDNAELAIWTKNGDHFQFSLQPTALYTPEWEKISVEPGVSIFKNNTITNGAYLVDDITQVDEEIEYKQLNVKRENREIIIDIQQLDQPQWLVLPIPERAGGGFTDKDGNDLEYAAYLNNFPAAKVTKAGQVIYKVTPQKTNNNTLYLLFFSLLVLVTLLIFNKKLNHFLNRL